MMFCLGCESVETTYRSVGAILHLSRRQIDACFEGFDFDQYVEQHWDDLDFDVDRILLNRLGSMYEVTPDPAWNTTCFFHLTRTLDVSHFASGIEPLTPAHVDAIWAALYPLVCENLSPGEWVQFRQRVETNQSNHSAHLYQLKTGNTRVYGGPYGILIRASAFHARALGNHDYLGIPEIVEDMGRCCEEWHGIPLCQRFQKQAKPCIVKFRVERRALLDDLGVALNYLSSSLEQEDPFVLTTAYSADGHPITSAQIERIECPPGVVWHKRAARS